MSVITDFVARTEQSLPWQSERAADWHPGSLWWDAHTVLVTREVAPGRWETLRRLVIPAGRGRLAFRCSSWSREAMQMRYDRRVIVQAGDRLGQPALGSRAHQGSVSLHRGGPWAERVEEGLRVKYGPRLALARIGHQLMLGSAPYGDLVAVVDVHENTGTLALP